ncbi:hypothetical protein ABZ436_15635 [Micromonospora matsumotoense]|uniref:hypothetical protein n=1 Tax=Micromonospora matsumotoense TaxID=121616 RepID=UPI0033F817B5
MSSPHQPPPGGTGGPSSSGGNNQFQYTYSSSEYSQDSYPSGFTPSNYSQSVASSSSAPGTYGQYGAADYQAEVGQPYDTSNSSGRSSPGPGDSIRVEWSEQASSEHSLDSQNRVMTWAQQAGRWVYENDEKIVNFVSLVASPGVQGGAGLGGNPVANSVGLALAAGPGMYVVGKEVINSLREGQRGDLVRAAYGAVAAAGAMTWGIGYAPGQNVTAGNAGAVVHGVGSGFMVTRGPREQPRRSHQDTESRGEIADTSSSHRRSGATSRRQTSRSHTTSRDHTSRDHTSRTTGRDEASAREPVSRRNGADRNRDNHGHRRGGGGASGGS